MKRSIVASIAVFALVVAGCSSSDPTASDECQAHEQELAQAEAQLVQVTAERDVLIADASAGAARYEKSVANTERVAAIIDDPDAVGTQEEVLDELTTLATPEAVMDDTAFGAVPIRQAWSNTLWGSDATIKTWVRWMCDDGSQAGSLWTWAGESRSGEPFELIGVNLDDYDDEGRVTYSLVDWPYDGAYVKESLASGNTTSDSGVPAGVVSSVDGFTAAVNAYDTEAVREFVTEDFTWQSTGPVQSLDEYLAYVDANYEAVGFHAEVTGERTIRLDGDAYVVEESGVVTTNNGDLFGITTYRVFETDNGWLIQEIRWVETAAESTD